jgi:glycosyltransferase involved in cell wall biosynthesis
MRTSVIELLGSDQTQAGFPIAVFQYGVETERLAERGASIRTLRDAASADPNTLRIVSNRAFLELYRIGLLIDALGHASLKGVKFHCDLIGDGPLRDQLKKQVEDAGLSDHIEFHGQLPPWEVEAVVAAADLYVSIAESDGVSLSLLEAMALGTMPLLSDIPANRLWIEDGVTGVLVGDTPEDVAKGIVRSLDVDRDQAIVANKSTVLARADRATNLGACELLIDELVGVVWDPG